MKSSTTLLVAVALLAGCGGGDAKSSTASSAAATTSSAPKPAARDYGKELDELQATACACKDAACADDSMKKLMTLAEAADKAGGQSPELIKKMEASATKIGECVATVKAAAPVGSGPLAKLSKGCEDLFAKMRKCGEAGGAAGKSAMEDAVRRLHATISVVPAAAQDDACKQAMSSLPPNCR
ncbi:MAG: hypothetical protein HY908_30415 [Myxococcales bacterium]|nr:hypothetical protein [Myxococcales bacterium]